MFVWCVVFGGFLDLRDLIMYVDFKCAQRAGSRLFHHFLPCMMALNR